MQELSKEQTEYAVGRLIRIVESRKIKQTQLEQWSGVNQSTISKILSPTQEIVGDRYTPSEEVLRRLFQALGLKLTDILVESDRIADEIIGYLATPLTGLTPDAELEVRRVIGLIRDVARDKQFDSPRFEIYWPGDHTHPLQNADISPNQVYVTDRSRASTHDFIILFCGSPSYGVGQENEIATQAGVPAIRLVPKLVSRMMIGSFLHTIDIAYSGSLETGVSFDTSELRTSLAAIRKAYFRHRALYRGINSDAFGSRLRKLIDDRCGDYEHFAADLGISLSYLHNLMEEPFAVSNPSARLLQRMALRLGERVAYLIGESEESDPVWVESNASWRSWIDKTPGLDARTALRMRDEWRQEYSTSRREEQTSASFRKPTLLMREPDWDKRYRQIGKPPRRDGAHATQQTLL
ncbi:MAG TPA: helix-turn-helix transcriptional regulator [Terriglobales bacterium]|jgi:transcriptional regulator with XRE-family HTH domain|nr:helix-turn-helix transcriptional regulator [Terriglobales bacterium]